MPAGRPPLDRSIMLDAIIAMPNVGRNVKKVSARKLADQLGINKETANNMIHDLESAGSLRIMKDRGGHGLLIEILG